MAKGSGYITNWGLAGDDIKYWELGPEGGNPVLQPLVPIDELMEEENEKLLEHALDLDEDGFTNDGYSLEDLLDGETDDTDSDRSKLIEKLKEKYPEQYDQLREKFGLNKLEEIKGKAGEKINKAIGKIPGGEQVTEKLGEVGDPRKIPKKIIQEEAEKQADSLLLKFFGTSLGEVGEAAAAWLWPAVLAVVVLVAVAGIGLIGYGIYLSTKTTPAAATPPSTTGGSPIKGTPDYCKPSSERLSVAEKKRIYGSSTGEVQRHTVSFTLGGKTVKLHEKVAPCYEAAKAEIMAGPDKNYNVKSLGGQYWRRVINSHCSGLVFYATPGCPLSNHSYGTALDINGWQGNGFCSIDGRRSYTLPRSWITSFRKYGVSWGGDYCDYMHFEFLRPPS